MKTMSRESRVKTSFSWIASLVLAMFVLTSCTDGRETSYHTFENGFETATKAVTVPCERNGKCDHVYRCDKTTYMVYNGTTSVPQTRWKRCPYSTQETDFMVETTIGDFLFGESVLTGEPFREDVPIPSEYETEPPSEWQNAYIRIDENKPSGVTMLKSTETPPKGDPQLYERHSDDITQLYDDNLLPGLPTGRYKGYQATKIHGVAYDIQQDYLQDIQNLNGALAVRNKDMDLHMVLIDDSVVDDADIYANSVVAYWQSDAFGNYRLADNAVVIVAGIDADNDTVAWVKTGGNAAKTNSGVAGKIREQLTDASVDEDLIGRPHYDVETRKITPSHGVLESVFWETDED